MIRQASTITPSTTPAADAVERGASTDGAVAGVVGGRGYGPTLTAEEAACVVADAINVATVHGTGPNRRAQVIAEMLGYNPTLVAHWGSQALYRTARADKMLRILDCAPEGAKGEALAVIARSLGFAVLPLTSYDPAREPACLDDVVEAFLHKMDSSGSMAATLRKVKCPEGDAGERVSPRELSDLRTAALQLVSAGTKVLEMTERMG
jgi:hypothetical protein